MPEKYMLKQDDDCHWYLVPESEWLSFDDLMTVDPEDLTADGEAYLDSMSIDGPHRIAFICPEEI